MYMRSGHGILGFKVSAESNIYGLSYLWSDLFSVYLSLNHALVLLSKQDVGWWIMGLL